MTEETLKRRRIAQYVCVVMLLAVFIGAFGFVYKLVQFAREAMGEDAASFAVVPVLTYACVAGGFLSLFLWSLSRGQFRDIEGPKYRLLEDEERYERDGV